MYLKITKGFYKKGQKKSQKSLIIRDGSNTIILFLYISN